jgi:hypothetical protein
MRGFSPAAFQARTLSAETKLEDFGDLTVTDSGSAGATRRLRLELHSPGYDLADLALLKVEEWFAWKDPDWVLEKYHYDYLDLSNSARLAYHRHDLGGAPNVVHAHCGPDFTAATEHLRATDIGLFEAIDDFLELYGGDLEVDCADFRPLEPSEFSAVR